MLRPESLIHNYKAPTHPDLKMHLTGNLLGLHRPHPMAETHPHGYRWSSLGCLHPALCPSAPFWGQQRSKYQTSSISLSGLDLLKFELVLRTQTIPR